MVYPTKRTHKNCGSYPVSRGLVLHCNPKGRSEGQAHPKTWMGKNIVIWCDDDDKVCIAESVCPHLGSDLGLTQEDAYGTDG